MRRRTLLLSVLVLAVSLVTVSLVTTVGEIAMGDTPPKMAAADSEAQLIEKLANGLEGQPLKDLDQLLVNMGARNIGIDIDPTEASPVSAIFGLRSGFLQNDRRVRIFMGLDADEVLGKLEATEFYTK